MYSYYNIFIKFPIKTLRRFEALEQLWGGQKIWMSLKIFPKRQKD
jgi:hypothetical protein